MSKAAREIKECGVRHKLEYGSSKGGVMKGCYFALLFLFLGVTNISAQTDPAWGTSAETAVVIGAYEFQGLDSGTTISRSPNTGDRYVAAGGNIAANFNLPKGALITGIEMQGCNTSPTLTTSYYLLRMLTGGFESIANGDVPPSSGCNTFRTNLSYVVDFSGPYLVIWQAPDPYASQLLTAIRVYYKLQVSPPPGTATFSDVPTTHLFFQYVEALAAAGITSGCGGGNFCPDAAVTRGQMAVFLAKALGLHWAP